MHSGHSFHIPVMGLGFTIDTPLKVSQYGIDSVISLGDDMLMEKIRKYYCTIFEKPFLEISEKCEDFRAKRITTYLNLVHEIATQQFIDLKNSAIEESQELKKYFRMLPNACAIKAGLQKLFLDQADMRSIKNWLQKNLVMGSIDVNIMTKVDKDNYRNGTKLPIEYNDAHAALRGYANSRLESGIVLSAGLNQKLFAYMEQFEDFYPNEEGVFKKRIILKVSEYRSAYIQGKYLAKRGLWVSEFRVESGLNCGGHAFATDGYLLGPVLEEFKNNREELAESLYSILKDILVSKSKTIPVKPLGIKITAQGGVGTFEEHEFLINHFHVDSVGWGTPFLLVPEVTAVDEKTLEKLINAREEDLYLSHISPFGIPFNNLRGNSKDIEKEALIQKGRPGSSCPKRLLALNNEFTEKSICTASREYQYYKLQELDTQNISSDEKKLKYDKIVEKSCICVGLGTSALLSYDLDTKVEGEGVSICPGPNLAYFSKKMSLEEMVDHIYGRGNVIDRMDRPNFIIKELSLYIDYLQAKIAEAKVLRLSNSFKSFISFSNHLLEGIEFYENLLDKNIDLFKNQRGQMLDDLVRSREIIKNILHDLEVSYL